MYGSVIFVVLLCVVGQRLAPVAVRTSPRASSRNVLGRVQVGYAGARVAVVVGHARVSVGARMRPSPTQRLPPRPRLLAESDVGRSSGLQSVPVLAWCEGRVHSASRAATSARAAADVEGGVRSGSPHASGPVK